MTENQKKAIKYLTLIENDEFNKNTLEQFLYDYPKILKEGCESILSDALIKIKPQIADYFNVNEKCVYTKNFNLYGKNTDLSPYARLVVVGNINATNASYEDFYEIFYVVGNCNLVDVSAMPRVTKVYGDLKIVGTLAFNTLPILREVGGDFCCEQCGLETIGRDCEIKGNASFKQSILPRFSSEKIKILGDVDFYQCAFSDGRFDVDGKVFLDNKCFGKYPRINIEKTESKTNYER